MKKFHVLVFGCQMNYADSARIKAVLTNCGWKFVEDISDADVVIFDTCSVRQKSEDKITGRLKEIWSNQKVWITGCMIQHNLRSSKLTDRKLNLKVGNFLWSVKSQTPEIIGLTTDEVNTFKPKSDLDYCFINHVFNPLFFRLQKKSKNVELFFRIDDTWLLPLMLKKLWYDVSYDQQMINEYAEILPEGINTSMNHHKETAYVPISTWCNQFCTYCIVPYARWFEKHLPIDHILQEVDKYLKSGVEEIVLLGQIVNKHPDFVDIIKKVLKLDWLRRLRYTSPYPTYYSDELLQLHEDEDKLCPHIHIPFQSGADDVLKKMARWYDSHQAYEFIDKIRSLKRKISITTDIIIWFSDESEDDFQKSMALAEYGKFDMIYMWIYSPRPGTLAHRKYEDNIPYKEKHARWTRMNALLKKISLENNLSEVWNTRKAIIDSQDEKAYFWYTDNMKQISIKKSDLILNIWDFVDVEIIWWFAFRLEWKILK